MNTTFQSRSTRRLLFTFAAVAALLISAVPSQAQAFDPAQGIQNYFDVASALNGDTYAAQYTPDGVLYDPVGTPAFRGHKAISEWVSSFRPVFQSFGFEVLKTIVVSPTEAAAHWRGEGVTQDGRPVAFEGIGFFRFNDEGKLREVREYWDQASVFAQIAGVPYEPQPFPFAAQLDTFFTSAATLDIDTLVSLFTPDGIFFDPAGTPGNRGEKAIREHLAGLTGPFLALNFTVEKVIPVSGTEAAVQWSLEAPTVTGKTVHLSGLSNFRFNEDGQLREVQEYWSLLDLIAQL
jgi:steroid Delta-isomerase